GGMVIGVRRPAMPGKLYWRITQWVIPFHTMIPPYGDNALNGHAFVPLDDENCMVWCFTHHPTRSLSAHQLETMRHGGGIHVKLVPGSFRPVINKDNDYMIDRVAQQHHKSYSGVKGIAMQDAAIQESWLRIAARRIWSRPTTASSWRVRDCAEWRSESRVAKRRTASSRQRTRCVRRRSCCRKPRASMTQRPTRSRSETVSLTLRCDRKGPPLRRRGPS